MKVSKLVNKGMLDNEVALELLEKEVTEIKEGTDLWEKHVLTTDKDVADNSTNEDKNYKEECKMKTEEKVEVKTCQDHKNDGEPCEYAAKYPEDNPQYCGIHWKKHNKWEVENKNKEEKENKKKKEAKTKMKKNKLNFKQITKNVHVKDNGDVYVDIRDLGKSKRAAKRVLFNYVVIKKVDFNNGKFFSHHINLVGKDRKKDRNVKAYYKRLRNGHYRNSRIFSDELVFIHTSLIDVAFKRYKKAQEVYADNAEKKTEKEKVSK